MARTKIPEENQELISAYTLEVLEMVRADREALRGKEKHLQDCIEQDLSKIGIKRGNWMTFYNDAYKGGFHGEIQEFEMMDDEVWIRISNGFSKIMVRPKNLQKPSR